MNDIIDAVLHAIAEFGTTAQAHAVPDENIEEIGADIVRRAARLRAV
jgi:hypothetical protein